MKKKPLGLLFLFISLGGVQLWMIQVAASEPNETRYAEHLQSAADFLRNVQFNPALNLCREAPYVANDTYWLLSDNLLAQYALKGYYPEISSAIMEELKRRGYGEDLHYSVLLGKPIPMPNKVMMTLVINETADYTIQANVRDESKYLIDWTRYADRLLFHSLSLAWKGDTEQAKEYFQYAMELWTGEGLMDPSTVQNGSYETYKLSMLLLASKVLEEPLPFQEELEERIWRRQQRDDGGIITHYNMTTLNPVGDANTETTAITIIAYLYEKPGLIDKVSHFLAKWTQTFPYNLITIVILSSIIYLVLERVFRRRGARKVLQASQPTNAG